MRRVQCQKTSFNVGTDDAREAVLVSVHGSHLGHVSSVMLSALTSPSQP